VFARFFGRPTRIIVKIGAAAPQPSPDAAAPAPSIAAAEAAERLARTKRVKDAARTHPNINEATRVLDGRIDDIEELKP
jgi:DNA polymerase III subunit gamma/tau